MIPFKKWSKILYSKPNQEYHFFNFLVLLFVVLLIVYLKTGVVSVSCHYAERGMECQTCGLTRAFRQLLNGNFVGVKAGHLWLFLLFMSQLLIRPLVSISLTVFNQVNLIKWVDILLTSILVLWTYKELLF